MWNNFMGWGWQNSLLPLVQNECLRIILSCLLFTLSKSQMIWLRSLMLPSWLAPSTPSSSQITYSVKEANITATVPYSSWYSSSWSLLVSKNQPAETKIGNDCPYLQNNVSNILIYLRQMLSFRYMCVILIAFC